MAYLDKRSYSLTSNARSRTFVTSTQPYENYSSDVTIKIMRMCDLQALMQLTCWENCGRRPPHVLFMRSSARFVTDNVQLSRLLWRVTRAAKNVRGLKDVHLEYRVHYEKVKMCFIVQWNFWKPVYCVGHEKWNFPLGVVDTLDGVHLFLVLFSYHLSMTCWMA